jgi:outer membrane protein assembly factor BamE (lipoprotein component of BamABCDE complex)
MLDRIFFESCSGRLRVDDCNASLFRPVVWNPAKVMVIYAMMIMMSACSKPQPVLDGIDIKSWKDDKNGCGTTRTQSLQQIRLQKEKLLALSELDIVAILGNPDRNELGKRNQKFYYYFLEPSEYCQQGVVKDKAARLAIRFNAMGLAKEVRVEMEY